MAAKALEKLAEVKISDRQLGRITEEIGTEMTQQRDLKTARHQKKTLPVAVAGIPSLVVVEIDGGRYLTRDPAAGTGPGARRRLEGRQSRLPGDDDRRGVRP